jgi:hypothetical protein
MKQSLTADEEQFGGVEREVSDVENEITESRSRSDVTGMVIRPDL